MALRQIVSFAQLPTAPFNQPTFTDFAPGPTRKLRGTPLYLYNNWKDNGSFVISVQLNQLYQQDGYLWLKRGYGNAQGNGTNVQPYSQHSLYAALSEVVLNLSATSKFGFGFRARIKDYLKYGVGVLHNAAQTTLINLFAVADIPNFKLDAPYYFEVEVDFGKLAINRWIDGVALSPVALNSAQVTALVASGFFSFSSLASINVDTYRSGYGGGPSPDQANNAQVGFRDIYSWEDTGDDSINKRLGPQVVRVQAPVSAESTDWVAVPSDKSVLEALNLPYTNAGIDGDQNAYVASGTGQSPVTLKFAAPASNLKVNGVALTLGAWRPTGSAGMLQSQVQVGQTKSAVKNLAVSTVPDYSLSAGVFEKAPDNTAWTPDKVGSAVLTLTPSLGG